MHVVLLGSLEALCFVVIPSETVHAVRSLMLLPSHAQVSQEQFDKIMFLINKGVEEGAKLEFGGKRYGARSPVVRTVRSLLLFSMLSLVMRLLLRQQSAEDVATHLMIIRRLK